MRESHPTRPSATALLVSCRAFQWCSGLALVSALSVSATLLAANDPPEFGVTDSVQAGGGGTSEGGEFSLVGTIGQVVAAPMEGADFFIQSGFWSSFQEFCTRADTNCDGVVDGADLATVLSEWGACVGCAGDLNTDGVVDGNDLGILLSSWG